MNDLQRCWQEKQKGFAMAATMIGKLLDSWQEQVAEIATLRAALDLEDADRKAMLAAVNDLYRTIAPILAAFRGDPKNPGPETGGTFTEDQLDAAIASMGELQRREAMFGANYFAKRDALAAPERSAPPLGSTPTPIAPLSSHDSPGEVR